MTIDEAIAYEIKIISSRRKHAENHCVTQEFFADIDYHEQLALWLEELKERKEKCIIANFKIDKATMQEMVDEKVKEIELDIQAIRNKTIDDFAKQLKANYTAYDIDLCLQDNDHLSYTNSCIAFESYIDEIAEQLKAGGNSDNTN